MPTPPLPADLVRVAAYAARRWSFCAGADLEDVEQAVALELWRHPPPSAHLWRRARFVTWRASKARGPRPLSLDELLEDQGAEPMDPSEGPDEQARRAELQAAVRAAVAELPPRQREAVEAFLETDGGTLAEIGEALGLTRQAAALRMERAREMLRLLLEHVSREA